jgi:hypothetical protein
MKVIFQVEVEVPDGATHYCGYPTDEEPTWFKSTIIAGHKYWWCWNYGKQGWYGMVWFRLR